MASWGNSALKAIKSAPETPGADCAGTMETREIITGAINIHLIIISYI